MHKRYKGQIFAAMIFSPLMAHAQTSAPIKVIEPQRQTSTKTAVRIDTERFQVGAYTGLLSVEDFSASILAGLSANYRISNRFMIQTNYATSSIERSNFEKREQLDFLTSDERTLTYANLLAGYKIFDARSFLGTQRKYDSNIYLLAGPTQVDFAGLSSTGFTLGMSYRFAVTDWLVTTMDVRDHIFSRSEIYSGDDSEKLTQNLEFSIGINAMF